MTHAVKELLEGIFNFRERITKKCFLKKGDPVIRYPASLARIIFLSPLFSLCIKRKSFLVSSLRDFKYTDKLKK